MKLCLGLAEPVHFLNWWLLGEPKVECWGQYDKGCCEAGPPHLLWSLASF